MKHATDKALDKLEDLIKEIRKFGKLKEKQRGIFYMKSIAFLHFHEDLAGLFGDLRIDNDFERFSVNSPDEKKAFLSKIKSAIENCKFD